MPATFLADVCRSISQICADGPATIDLWVDRSRHDVNKAYISSITCNHCVWNMQGQILHHVQTLVVRSGSQYFCCLIESWDIVFSRMHRCWAVRCIVLLFVFSLLGSPLNSMDHVYFPENCGFSLFFVEVSGITCLAIMCSNFDAVDKCDGVIEIWGTPANMFGWLISAVDVSCMRVPFKSFDNYFVFAGQYNSDMWKPMIHEILKIISQWNHITEYRFTLLVANIHIQHHSSIVLLRLQQCISN